MKRYYIIFVLMMQLWVGNLLGAEDPKLQSLDWKNALVLNARGTQIDDKLDLNNHILITPDNLKNSYVLGFDPERHVQKKFRNGFVKPVHNGAWTVYGKPFTTRKIQDILLKPWKKKEMAYFAKRISTDPTVWSYLDNKKGLYFDRDPNAVLVVRKTDGTFVYLKGFEAKDYFDGIYKEQHHYAEEGLPIFLYAPQVGKIKIITDTKLSDVLSIIQKLGGNKVVLLIASNSFRPINKTLTLDADAKDISLADSKNLTPG